PSQNLHSPSFPPCPGGTNQPPAPPCPTGNPSIALPQDKPFNHPAPPPKLHSPSP
ncbi:hypothetical protein T484DRAFT_1555274, partial [Baffinella frigidus]